MTLPPNGPYVIGGTGGSGTRVVAKIARQAGLFIGRELHRSEDPLRFIQFADRWVDAYAARERSRFSAWSEARMRRQLGAFLRAHCAGMTSAERPWGWKQPRTLYLLPFLHEELPGLRFVHVVRDGRDMALSPNQYHLRHVRAVLGKELSGRAEPVGSIALWSRVNLAAADYAELSLGGGYLRLRFEDLCADPPAAIEQLLGFFGLSGNARDLAAEVSPPPTIGRWRSAAPELQAELNEVGCDALARFGYPLG